VSGLRAKLLVIFTGWGAALKTHDTTSKVFAAGNSLCAYVYVSLRLCVSVRVCVPFTRSSSASTRLVSPSTALDVRGGVWIGAWNMRWVCPSKLLRKGGS